MAGDERSLPCPSVRPSSRCPRRGCAITTSPCILLRLPSQPSLLLSTPPPSPTAFRIRPSPKLSDGDATPRLLVQYWRGLARRRAGETASLHDVVSANASGFVVLLGK